MAVFSGSCLCGSVSFKSQLEPLRTFNCHCEDCRKSSGAPFLTNIFVKENDVKIIGQLSSYKHLSDSGHKLTKKFCAICGCQMFSLNEGRPGLIRIHAGTINELDIIKPQGDVWVSQKIPSIILDNQLKQHEKNPI